MAERSSWPRPAPGGYRFPVGPLLEVADVALPSDLAIRVGVHVRSVNRATHDGLNADTADRWAIALGYHPCLIWTDWFDSALADA